MERRGPRMDVWGRGMSGSSSGCRRLSAGSEHKCWEPMRKTRLGRKHEHFINIGGRQEEGKIKLLTLHFCLGSSSHHTNILPWVRLMTLDLITQIS